MPTFRYKGRNLRGEAVTGTLEADSPQAAVEQLSNAQVIALEITEIRTPVLGPERSKRHSNKRLIRVKVPLRGLLPFTRQMAALLSTGVPLRRALVSQIESCTNEHLREALKGVRGASEAGRSLADGMALYPNVFPEYFIHMVRIGEVTGNLEEIFYRLSYSLEYERCSRNHLRQALHYPIAMLGALALVFVALNVVVIPKSTAALSTLEGNLSFPMRALLGVSEFTRSYGLLLLIGFGGGVLGWRQYVRTAAGRQHWDRLKLRFPLIGELFFDLAMVRFGRILATIASSGIPVSEGLRVATRAVENHYIGGQLEAIRWGVERGDGLYTAARRSELFPLAVLQMIEIGEETGTVDEVMDEIAESYEQEVELTIDHLSRLSVPILVVLVSIMVLFLVLCLQLPLWSLSQAPG